MSKFLTKSVKQVTFLSVILAIILAAAIVVGTLFGFNKEATVSSNQTLTVSGYNYNELALEDIKNDCEEFFPEATVYEMSDVSYGDMVEYVYVFSADADLEESVAAMKAYFAERKADPNDALYHVDFDLQLHKECAVSYLAEGYVCHAVIAGAVFAILAFVYVALRFKRWDMGLLVALSIVLGMGFTTALIALVRIPVTASTVYAVVVAGLLSAAVTMMTLHRVRLASKDESSKNQSAAEIVTNAIAWKEIVSLCSIVAIAMVVTGVLIGMAGIWFALSALVGIAVATFIGVLYAPAAYIPLKAKVDAKIANKTIRYKGAEKTSTKVKKSAKKAEAPAEEVAEEPVEEAEAPAEEVAEEPIKKAEAPAEESND